MSGKEQASSVNAGGVQLYPQQQGKQTRAQSNQQKPIALDLKVFQFRKMFHKVIHIVSPEE
jgi:hypothetical protein